MLDGWKISYPLPSGITRDVLNGAMVEAHAALRPATGKEFGVIIDRLFRFAETFSIKDSGIREAMRFYVEALDDIPPDLLEKAVDGVVRTYKYGNRMPPPADLRAVVEQDLRERMNARLTIETALKFGKQEEPRKPATPEQKARVAAILVEARRGLTDFDGRREKPEADND